MDRQTQMISESLNFDPKFFLDEDRFSIAFSNYNEGDCGQDILNELVYLRKNSIQGLADNSPHYQPRLKSKSPARGILRENINFTNCSIEILSTDDKPDFVQPMAVQEKLFENP